VSRDLLGALWPRLHRFAQQIDRYAAYKAQTRVQSQNAAVRNSFAAPQT